MSAVTLWVVTFFFDDGVSAMKSNRMSRMLLICGIAGFYSSSAWSAEPTTSPAQPTITLDAYWLRLAPDQVPSGNGVLAASLLTDPKVLYARSRAVGYLGQAVTTNVTRTVDVVTGATPVVAPGVSTYDLTTTAEKFGVSLTETPIQLEGNALAITFDSTVTIQPENGNGAPTSRPSTEPVTQSDPLAVNSARELIGTASVALQSSSTLKLEVGVPKIVSGMSDHPGASDNRALCLVLCATVAK
jgi:hypothetical protein